MRSCGWVNRKQTHRQKTGARNLPAYGVDTGQRTIHHAARGSRVRLFVREHRKQGPIPQPFLCLGFAS